MDTFRLSNDPLMIDRVRSPTSVIRMRPLLLSVITGSTRILKTGQRFPVQAAFRALPILPSLLVEVEKQPSV